MKLENLSDAQQNVAAKIFNELIGFTVREAKDILKYIAGDLDNRAVVDEGDNNDT